MTTTKNELEIAVNPPLVIAAAPNTDVPIITPPATGKSLLPLTFLWSQPQKRGRTRLLMMRQILFHAQLHSLVKSLVSRPIAASAMYIRTSAIATIASTSEICCLRNLCWICIITAVMISYAIPLFIVHHVYGSVFAIMCNIIFSYKW